MTIVERSIFIDASAEAVEAVTLDPYRLPDWYAGVQQVEADGLYPQPGGCVMLTYKAAGMTFHLSMTSRELVPGQHALYEMAGMIAGTNLWTHQPEGSGTRLSARFEYELPGGGVGQALDHLLIERMNTEQLEKSLARVKAIVESGG